MKGLFSWPRRGQSAPKADNRQKHFGNPAQILIFQALAPACFSYADVSKARFPAHSGGNPYSVI
ncbi:MULTISPECIES: hypothetical protein [Comamonas]|jgi:hypothetical protein|uniref:hypothetical protein n=1 Tax=Comamonas TaxID=283 RepID=UPI0025EF88EB|nr:MULTISPECIES: hypothetical protein [Comamonas]MDR3063919.1 hypothetical protein [Comamonas sp.]MEB5967178.1 hypothetical protein [Comamonas testosteroni]